MIEDTTDEECILFAIDMTDVCVCVSLSRLDHRYIHYPSSSQPSFSGMEGWVSTDRPDDSEQCVMCIFFTLHDT